MRESEKNGVVDLQEGRRRFSLTPMQKGMLYQALASPRSGYDVEHVIGTLNVPLDTSAFQRAWQRLVDRHVALRLRFSFDDGGNPYQFPVDDARIAVEVSDWADRASEEQDRLLRVYLQEDRSRGFDPRSDLLIRVAVFRLGESRYRFVWTWWHGVLDGRARLILLKELFSFYEAFRRGEDVDLPQPRPFTDFADWLDGVEIAAAEPFWRELLKGFDQPTPIAADRPAAAEESADFGDHELRLTEAESLPLRDFAAKHGLTMNSLVQGAWALVLSMHTEQDDVVFGTTRACRRSAFGGDGTGDGVVGMLINTVPVRVKTEPSADVVSWLEELRAQHLAVRPYERTPLAPIQAWSGVPADRRLFESLVIYENAVLDTALRSQGKEWESYRFEIRGRTGFPLTVYVYESGELVIQVANDRARVEDQTARRMLAHLITTMQSVAGSAGRTIDEVSLLSDAERRQLLEEFTATAVDYPREQCVPQLFETQAARSPDATAVVFQDRSLSYAQLNARANQLARHLRDLGVRPGVLVGICVERSPEMVTGILGILKAGGAYVPLDPAFPRDRLAFMAADAELGLIVTTESSKDAVPDAGRVLIFLDSGWEPIGQQPAHDLDPIAGPEDIAYVIYTSGSTGKPKGVEIPHRALTNLLWSMRTEPGCRESDVLLAVTTLSFDIAGLEIYLPLIVGGRIVLASQMVAAEGRRLRALLEECGATLMQATPATWRMLIDAGWKGTPGLTALCGGEGLPRDLADRLLERTAALWNMYGPTETTIWSSVQRIGPDDAEITVGRPIANTDFFVVDKNLRLVPVGVPGELVIGGDGLARGYRNRPELTAERFISAPFSGKRGARVYRTGDRVRYRQDGQVVHLGRLDHQVKLRGFRVELGEIEAILGQHPAVRKNVVVARTGDGGSADTSLAAYVVAEPGATLTVGELRRFLQGHLPAYMIPAAFVPMEALPLTPNGKVDRRALPAPGPVRPELESAYVAARTPAEQALVDIWKEVLNAAQVGVHDNFFELGGHSLRAMQLMARVDSSFKVELPLRALLEAPTVAGLAAAIALRQAEGADAGTLARILAELESLPPEAVDALLAAECVGEGDRHE
jgi:amino acid adenylation domain-containing protein